MTISTVNFQTFSELAFKFTLTPGIIVESMIFALAMGLIGGVLPALRASRMKIVDACAPPRDPVGENDFLLKILPATISAASLLS